MQRVVCQPQQMTDVLNGTKKSVWGQHSGSVKSVSIWHKL